MKNKFKYGITFFLAIAIVIVSINLFEPNKEQKVRGNIEILVNEDYYEYLKECADSFMEDNIKANIQVREINDYEYVDNINTQIQQGKLTNIAQLDRLELEKISLENFKFYDEISKTVETYSKNFATVRLNEVKIDNHIIGVPLSSRPLVLYLREDMLNQYGYHSEDISTWNDIINIGKDIYNKSNGNIKILNATGKDYDDLVSLLIMQYLDEDNSIDIIKNKVENKIQQLKDNNILNLNEGNEFLARISSINGMKELMSLDKPCEWFCTNPPSKEVGTNRFFCAEGDNLIVLDQNNENQRLIQKFITFVITNNKDTIKYIKKGNFFSSYLYTYKNVEIEDQVKNFKGKSPLVIMSNAQEKAPEVKDYEKYIKIKTQMLNY
ncbi:extracellular solute-binding protein [Clostridium uliginosum]|uniref:Multiple sugar transport system substrate-binding protein n=1 Tax=Clostridium uliginosum TaxID=119641 RepID=A0A1I1IDC7_9CLOT|nr:ABC transporter substrate-binding protein [Clostridium uliginosum]SFC33981.1 multiple sugar transport system substrate-binding protein [Clostridium uliginosum]